MKSITRHQSSLSSSTLTPISELNESTTSNSSPPPQNNNGDDKEPSRISYILSTILVDGIIQGVLTWWTAWIMHTLSIPFNPYFWLAGVTLFFFSCHPRNNKLAALILFRQVQILCITSLIILLF